MKKLFLLLLIVYCISLSAQIEIINTGHKFNFFNIDKINDNIFISGDSTVLLTCNGSCDILSAITLPPLLYVRPYIDFTDSQNIYVLSTLEFLFPYHSILYHSSDKGNSWNKILDTTRRYYQMAILDDLNGVLIEGTGRFLRTTDGGASWADFYGPMIYNQVVSKYNENRFCIVESDSFCITIDKGYTWDCHEFIKSNPKRLEFYTDSILLGITSLPVGYITYSMDGGANWTSHPLKNDAYGIAFLGLNEIYVVGSGNCIYRTTDLGANWDCYPTGINGTLLDIAFINDSIALVSGVDGILFKWNKNSMLSAPIKEVQQIPINISPNPTTDQQKISFYTLEPKQVNVRLFNITGNFISYIHSGTSEVGMNVIEADLQFLTSGIYFYEMNIGGNVVQKKIVKQ